MDDEQIVFSHYWVSGFGWENTIYQPEDFETVEVLGNNKEDGTVYVAKNSSGTNHILKGVVK